MVVVVEVLQIADKLQEHREQLILVEVAEDVILDLPELVDQE